MSRTGLAIRSWRYVNDPAPRLCGLDVLLGLLGLLVAATVGRNLGGFQLFVLTTVVIFTIVGASHVILFGAAGQPSIGHAAILGAGAYTGLFISGHTSFGLPTELLVALVMGAAIGFLIGLPSLRIGGLYLAIATLALGAVGEQVFFEWTSVTGGGAGQGIASAKIFGTVLGNLYFFYACLIVAGVLLLVARNALRGRIGLAWSAVRTNPSAATVLGISAGRYKTMSFALSGAMVSVAGVLYVHSVNYVAPEDFSIDLSILTLVVAIIGGQRYLWGAALGSAFVMGLPELLRQLGQYRLMVYGLVFILVMIFFPQGFAGGIRVLWRRFLHPVSARYAPAALHVDPDSVVASSAEEPATLRSPRGLRAEQRGDENPIRGLVVDSVRVSYGGVIAVAEASIGIDAGEIVGLVGPNGAGKSTLLNAISGLAPVTSGRVLLNGADLTRRPARERAAHGVGRTLQNLSLHAGLTVLDHAMLGQHTDRPYGIGAQLFRSPSYSRGETWMLARARETLQALDLMGYAHDEIDNLPYGVQKRVDVARAIAGRPTLLLLDEPAAGLTPQEADELIDVVLTLSAEVGATVIMVEHNLDLVMRVTRRVVALDAGCVIADGTPETVRTTDDFVRSYIGA